MEAAASSSHPSGKDYGTKKGGMWLTDHTHIRKISTVSNAYLNVTIYVNSTATVEFSINGTRTVKKIFAPGEHVVKIPGKMIRGKENLLEMRYQDKKVSGSASYPFFAR